MAPKKVIMESSWQRIIKLIQKTGDRFIILDSQQETSYVVMSFNEYEKLQNQPVTDKDIEDIDEVELLERINKEIAIWRSQQEAKATEKGKVVWEKETLPTPVEVAQPAIDNLSNLPEEKNTTTETEDKYYFEPVES